MIVTKRLLLALAVAGFILVAAWALKYAQGLEIIDAEAARRTIQVIIGLVLAVYGNFMPKDIASRSLACATSRSQSALRVGGWSMALAGLGHAGLWAFAPIAVADIASMVVVASATVVTIAYGSWVLLSCRRAGTSPST